MTPDDPADIRQCPPWCTGDDDLPACPEDGFWHYGEPVTITVTHGRGETIDLAPLEITLQAWSAHQTAAPDPALISLSLDHDEGPHLTPAETRKLAAALLRLTDLAEQPPKKPSPNPSGLETP